MADNDRYRGYDQDRRRDDDWRQGGRSSYERGGYGSRQSSDFYGRSADYGHRDEDGYIARRGFGNESSGYGRGGSGEWRRDDRGGGYGARYGEDDWRSQGYGRMSGRDRSESDQRFGGEGRWSGGEGRWSGGEGRWSGGGERRWRPAESSGYGREGRWSRERDFGDSAGYGSGGSARDWRDVMEENRTGSGGYGYDSMRERGYAGGYGAADYGRTGSSRFGRGSREDDEDRGFFERAGDEVRSWFGDEDAERRREQDMRQGHYGEHRGRGPKNYARSDDRIRDDVNDRLTDDPHIDASDIEVSVSNHEVTLSGRVNSRFAKRHAEDIAESVSGVTHVQNNLRVQQPTEAMASGAGGTATSGTAMGSTATGSAETSLGGTSSASGGRRRSSSTAGT
jgi:osmotically-inducible protein OsmY